MNDIEQYLIECGLGEDDVKNVLDLVYNHALMVKNIKHDK